MVCHKEKLRKEGTNNGDYEKILKKKYTNMFRKRFSSNTFEKLIEEIGIYQQSHDL